jgi:intracellular multiplication protein IcmK
MKRPDLRLRFAVSGCAVAFALSTAQPVFAAQDAAPAAPSGQTAPKQDDKKTSAAQAPSAAASAGAETSSRDPYYLPPLPVPPQVRSPVGALVNNTFPLSESEIEWVKQRAQNTTEAVHARVPVSLSNPILRVAVGPGAAVPVIHVAPGFVASISFVDSTGAPWNVTGFTAGGDAFRVLIPAPTLNGGSADSKKENRVETDVPRNMLNIQATAYDSSGNLIVTLQGLNEPIMLELRSGSAQLKKGEKLKAYGMTTLSVAGSSPTAPPPVVAGTPRGPDQLMMAFLQNVPPEGAIPMPTNNAHVKAWRYQGQIFVRSSAPIRSPAWLSQYTQGDVGVYQFSHAGVLLVRGTDGELQPVALSEPPTAMFQPAHGFVDSKQPGIPPVMSATQQ